MRAGMRNKEFCLRGLREVIAGTRSTAEIKWMDVLSSGRGGRGGGAAGHRTDNHNYRMLMSKKKELIASATGC